MVLVQQKVSSILLMGVVVIIVLFMSVNISLSQNNPDSSDLSIQFAVGSGIYNYSSENISQNPPKIFFIDEGISVDYYFSAFRLGIKSGVSQSQSDDLENNSAYINPNIGFISKYVCLDVGYLFFGSKKPFYFTHPFTNNTRYTTGLPSGSLRLGELNSLHLLFSFANNLPLRSATGLFEFGAGYKVEKTNTSLFFGVGISPYKSLVCTIHQDIPLSEKISLNLRGNVGGFKGFECGIAIGSKIWL
jgi:hypothetical protein